MRRNSQTLKIEYNVEVSVDFNATLGTFVNALKNFDIYKNGYGISGVSLETTDDLGNPVGADVATTYAWTVSIWSLRSDAHLEDEVTF